MERTGPERRAQRPWGLGLLWALTAPWKEAEWAELFCSPVTGLDVGRTNTLPVVETVQAHQISVVRFQVRDGDVMLVALYINFLKLPILVCVLDLEGVKFSLSCRPGEMQAVWGGLLQSHLPDGAQMLED